MDEALKLGCYFSIPTNVVRSMHFQKMIERIPREKILTETDSPYLSPFKFGLNEPKFIEESIRIISSIWGICEENVECQINLCFQPENHHPRKNNLDCSL